jgi:hypothetical protein
MTPTSLQARARSLVDTYHHALYNEPSFRMLHPVAIPHSIHTIQDCTFGHTPPSRRVHMLVQHSLQLRRGRGP